MKTKHQLLIDQFIAKPIAFCLNFLVRIVGKILAIDHNLDKEFNTIVICKFKGLGSIIQSTPMLQTLRKQYPNAEIIFLSTKANVVFLSKIKDIDTVITIDDSKAYKLVSSLSKAIITLMRKRPEVYIDLEIYSNFSTLVTLATLSKNRIGFYLRSSSFRMGIYTHMMYYNTNVPIADVYLQIARLFNPSSVTTTLYPIYQNLDKYPLVENKAVIVVNPNASDLRIERRWSAENFNRTIAWLCINFPDKEIAVVGSPSEKAYVDEVLNGLQFNNLNNLAGSTTVDELIALIRDAELLITNDTGPMHIAFACKTATLALFGPCSPDQYGWSENTKILYKRVYCSPCVHEFVAPPCKGNNVCMQLISWEEVRTSLIGFFENNHVFKSDLNNDKSKINYQFNQHPLGLVNRNE